MPSAQEPRTAWISDEDQFGLGPRPGPSVAGVILGNLTPSTSASPDCHPPEGLSEDHGRVAE